MVIDELETLHARSDLGLAYIYIDYKDQTQQTPLNIAACFLKQLVQRVHHTAPELRSIYRKFCGRGSSLQLSDIIELLTLISLRFSCTFVILDALDEFNDHDRPSLLSLIHDLSKTQIRIFSTCRPHLRDIRQFFKSTPQIRIVADRDDLKNFMDIKLNERFTQSTPLKTRIVEKLSSSAQGVYIPSNDYVTF